MGSQPQISTICWSERQSSTLPATVPDLLERRRPIRTARVSGDGHEVTHLILCTVMGHGFRATPAQ
jgi:hypothetical protein